MGKVMQYRFLALAAALCVPVAVLAHNNTPPTLTSTPASACIAQNFDGTSAPTLPSGWTSTVATGAATTLPGATRSVGYADTGSNAVWLDDYNDYADVSLYSPVYGVAHTVGLPYVTFRHSFVLWSPDASALNNGAYNGAVLEVSVNGGAFADLLSAGGSFFNGGYNSQLDSGSDNPIAQPPLMVNRAVWSGDSKGYMTTTVLVPAASYGGTVQFRWRLGTEGGSRSYDTHSGWWIDTLQYGGLGDEIMVDGFDAPCMP